MRRLIALGLVVLAGLAVVFPPEWIRKHERRWVGQLVLNDHLATARRLYGAMAYVQRDPVALNNYHALTWAHAVPAGGKVRKNASRAADQAWRQAGKQGVAAAYWNLAMFNIKRGRKSKRSDRNTTGWLRWAARSGIAEAQILLDAGDDEYDRIRELMQLGDRGAAATMASVLWHKQRPAESRAALRQAAKAGHIASMARLGFLLANQLDVDEKVDPKHAERAAEAEKWLTRAAKAGHVLAAYRLGQCHAEPAFYCETRDPEQALAWFTRAARPYPRFQPPEIDLDSQHAIRLGMMPRWFINQSDIAAKAQQAIDELQ